MRATVMWGALFVFFVVMGTFAAGFRSWALLAFAVGAGCVVIWAVGGFDRSAWIADDETSERLSRVDEDIDRAAHRHTRP